MGSNPSRAAKFILMNKIESHHIETSQYGLVTLLINTSERWCEYIIDETLKEVFIHVFEEESKITNDNSSDKLVLTLDFLDKEKEYSYMRLDYQEKDQICIYWIPLRLRKGDEHVNKIKQMRDEKRSNIPLV